MSYEEMRTAIRGVYHTESWNKKVDNMLDSQVVAIYLKFKREGKFDKYSEETKFEKECGSGRLTPVFTSESLIDLDKRIDRLIRTLREFCINLTDEELEYMRGMTTYKEAYAYYQKMIRERL
jgi:hypothetical protein